MFETNRLIGVLPRYGHFNALGGAASASGRIFSSRRAVGLVNFSTQRLARDQHSDRDRQEQAQHHAQKPDCEQMTEIDRNAG